MEKEKKETVKEQKSSVVKITILVSLLMCASAVGGYLVGVSKVTEKIVAQNDAVKSAIVAETDNDTDTGTTKNDNSANLDFDFSELSNTLHASIQKDNITSLISSCENKTINENDPPEAEQTFTEVSSNTIDTIINKLKTAKSIKKEITYSWNACPPKSITYYVSVNSTNQNEVHAQRVFSLNYADDSTILLVGYNNLGYAFYFNSSEEINNFIESLK